MNVVFCFPHKQNFLKPIYYTHHVFEPRMVCSPNLIISFSIKRKCLVYLKEIITSEKSLKVYNSELERLFLLDKRVI
jgi:hypothetical protein